jgi:HD superfamily phosphohydrolase
MARKRLKDPQPTQALPSRIGSFEVIGSLGRGSFAETYRVKGSDGTVYALKQNLAGDADHVTRLRNEAKVLRTLSHAGIPGFIEAAVDPEPFLVMELMPGATVQGALAELSSSGAVFGDLETLRVLHGLLDVLSYLASKKVVHRDVKAANVMMTSSGSHVSLIDFGFSKADGTSEIRMDDSFLRAGAVRYSPPRKLASPGLADASHDVFAAGVLVYQMLTDAYPWSVPKTADFGAYQRKIESTRATPILDLNPRVRPEIAELVMALIRLEDTQRPSAKAARESASDLLKGLPHVRGRTRRERLGYPHVSRDPLYGDVRLTEFEWSVLKSPEMQRLRDIRQLGLTNMIFVGAEHSRLSHAIGCLHRVEQIFSTIEAAEGIGVALETRLVGRLYALTHDVTHVAYGHTVEDELGIFENHDDNLDRRKRLLLHSDSDLNRILQQDEIGREVLDHFDPEATVQQRTGIPELVSGSTGADVLDYIDRDAYHCGLDHRVDSAIFRQFRWHREDGSEPRLMSLLYGKDGLRVDRAFAVEDLLSERYAMFLKVYTNKTKTAASALLGKSLIGALYPPGRGKPDFTETAYEWFADQEVIVRLAGSRKGLPAELANELRSGKLPRAVYRAQLLSEADRNAKAYEDRLSHLREEGYLDPAERSETEAALAKMAGLDPADVLIYCPVRAPGYSRVKHVFAKEPRRVTAVDRGNSAFKALEDRHLGLWELWVFTRATKRDSDSRLSAAVEEKLGIDNLIAHERRADRLW